ncbi:Maf family protein [Piscirickettsia salmonis]|uniref:dTTP/UTP pyrophosphatase n=1 Tax=Piscirickettsia salmonis TaxID=1238 RepID=A0A9Q5YIV6_PISSA|nr:Maf family protein [Piscirickettsia salmonis]APS58131.1 septum formation protein Maf [Piscirickettsia salmonis]ERL62312.1 septum formation protein Maf [Piscirickettsia salmonis LF-89 = ATCC VR-1361]PEQ17499.1 septum formation inhibitor Maf [Piscirickettsia salmonis]QGN76433.1 Maf-like protein YhdE [Piscirickettsia salmonis]QGN80023.1 Maf-like protein YhdE [Piscirickettsia salmonis]
MSAQLYLASTSPRRRELLRQLNLSFDTLDPNIDESIQSNERAEDYVLRMAREKARVAFDRLDASHTSYSSNTNSDVSPIVLAADTAVICDQDILGKPVHQQQGQAMLNQLSGRSHWVYSAVTCMSTERLESVLVKSKVYFRTLTRQEIVDYWQTGEPEGKAGGYAIQGVAAIFIERLEGSFSAVMGLPLFEVNALLEQFNIRALG